jgi:lipid-A-disaccharide synthase
VELVCGQTYELLAHAEAAVVTSGTATLETALLGVPEVVCYRTDRLSYLIARMFVKIRHISLVNIIMDRTVVTELIQGDMALPRAEAELRAILRGGARRAPMLSDFAALRTLLGTAGASDRFAARMVAELESAHPAADND